MMIKIIPIIMMLLLLMMMMSMVVIIISIIITIITCIAIIIIIILIMGERYLRTDNLFVNLYYYSWFIKNQDSQPMAELLTILHVWITIRCIHINIKYKFTNKLYNKLELSHIESDNKNA